MKIRVYGIHPSIKDGINHSRRLGKPIIVGVLFSERERGLYRVSPSGDYRYIQPLPNRFIMEKL